MLDISIIVHTYTYICVCAHLYMIHRMNLLQDEQHGAPTPTNITNPRQTYVRLE